ncbi:hypothetical protein AB0346_26670, partial [Nocardia beijingensis]
MRFAVSYSTPFFGVDPDRLIGYAQHAERCGFEAIYLPEHIALYPGATVGPMEITRAGRGAARTARGHPRRRPHRKRLAARRFRSR